MSVALVNFQQGKWEILKEYLAYFNSLALEIKDLNEGIVVHQIMTGLRARHFSLSLAKKPTTSLADLLAHSKKYINVKEIEMARRQVDQNQANHQPMRKKPRDRSTFTPQEKYHNYEPLITSINDIIKDVRATELMQFPPQKKRKFPLANKSKYCKFHQDYSHNTDDCITLRDETETLIRRGKLAKYRRYGG